MLDMQIEFTHYMHKDLPDRVLSILGRTKDDDFIDTKAIKVFGEMADSIKKIKSISKDDEK